MKYFVPGSHGIWVTKDCNFLDSDDEVCELPIYNNLVEIVNSQVMLSRRIEITDKVTQEKTIYHSEREVAQALNIDRKQVHRMTLKPNDNDRWLANRIYLP